MTLTTAQTNAITASVLSSLKLTGSEISAYDAASKRIFVTSNSGLQIIDFANPSAPVLVTSPVLNLVALGALSNDVQSVSVKNGVVAVAVRNLDKTMPGEVIFLNASTGALLGKVSVGANPDMVTFTPDGTKLLVANEGELRSTTDVAGTVNATSDGVVDTNIDPEGSVSIITLANVASAATFSANVATANFNSFNAQAAALQASGVRLFAGVPAGSTTVSQDLEPEYLAVSPDGTTALVTLQENNAVARLDIATATFTSIVPLG
jgi:DNA-binding beta-propeller fold protein YncE